MKAPEHNLHKEKIVAQAMQIFLKQGIKAVRMDDIAQMMGISKRTLYELFGDKETLLFWPSRAISGSATSAGPV